MTTYAEIESLVRAMRSPQGAPVEQVKTFLGRRSINLPGIVFTYHLYVRLPVEKDADFLEAYKLLGSSKRAQMLERALARIALETL